LSSPVADGTGAGAAAVVTLVAADGTPPAQDTAMVTVLAVVVNTTRAVVAGPRATLLAVKPCCGLHDSRKAPAVAHWATTVPPDELRTVPLVLAVRPDAAEPPVPAPPVPLFPPVLLWDRCAGEEEGCATAWLACASAAAATLDCWLAGEAEMPSPSSDTTYRPPAVAAAAPSSHAPLPMTMRVRMLPESRVRR
jgi:hypothetical protein